MNQKFEKNKVLTKIIYNKIRKLLGWVALMTPNGGDDVAAKLDYL